MEKKKIGRAEKKTNLEKQSNDIRHSNDSFNHLN